MGQVYRAAGTNHHVAIKVLPASVAGDADRLARFQREAEVLAAINHPNIAQIYGLEKSEGVTALVMELVEGADLSERIARGAIPVDEALPIAKQIAGALEAAHEQGIIHRDQRTVAQGLDGWGRPRHQTTAPRACDTYRVGNQPAALWPLPLDCGMRTTELEAFGCFAQPLAVVVAVQFSLLLWVMLHIRHPARSRARAGSLRHARWRWPSETSARGSAGERCSRKGLLDG